MSTYAKYVGQQLTQGLQDEIDALAASHGLRALVVCPEEGFASIDSEDDRLNIEVSTDRVIRRVYRG